jgi:hypothetical protein
VAQPPLIPDKEPTGASARLAGGRSGTKVSISPGRLIKFLIWCLVIGLVLSFFGLDAVDFWRGVWGMIEGLYDTLVSSIGSLGSYILIGAMVIIPIWIIRTIWRRLDR